jgi:predicted nucleic acid-binding protein
MTSVFADAAHYVALILRRDGLHAAALTVGNRLRATPKVTTDAVLVEVLAFASNRGAGSRSVASALVDEVVADPLTTIVHQSAELFFAGVDLYRRRLDKGYSLTDCMSMVLCGEQGIADVLTHDRHFEQEGFAILL